MLSQRRRRRANINPALGECILFAGWTGIACSLMLAAITNRHRPNVSCLTACTIGGNAQTQAEPTTKRTKVKQHVPTSL